MATAGVSWLGVFAVFGALLHTVVLGRELIDMAGPGCFSNEELPISDSQIFTLYADYNYNHEQTLDHCDVSIRATQANRRLRYLVEKLTIFDCGITIYVFDNPQTMPNTPSRILKCSDDKSLPIQGITSHGVVKFSLRKESAQAAAFTFQIQVTTDFGPDIDFEKNDSEFYEAPLDTGAIVGIAIAGVILIIALVGLAIYCCLKNRMENMKYAEASEAQSAPSVFTSGTSQVMFPSANHHRKGGGGGSGGKYGSMEDVRSSNSSTDKAYANNGYQADGDEKRFKRQGSGRREKGGHYNTAFDDEADATKVRGGHVARRDSGRSGKFDKKGNLRREEYEMSKVNKMPVNGILKTRSKSPNRSHSSTEGSTVDSNAALVYGYSQTTHVHPNTQHIPVLERTRSRSRSRGTASHRSGGSAGRSRSGSVGKASGKEKAAAPNNARQYSDMSHFLDKPKHSHRPRSRSGSMGRRTRSDSRNSDNVPSEVSFAPSGASSKKNVGGKRVHIQGVESDI